MSTSEDRMWLPLSTKVSIIKDVFWLYLLIWYRWLKTITQYCYLTNCWMHYWPQFFTSVCIHRLCFVTFDFLWSNGIFSHSDSEHGPVTFFGKWDSGRYYINKVCKSTYLFVLLCLCQSHKNMSQPPDRWTTLDKSWFPVVVPGRPV